MGFLGAVRRKLIVSCQALPEEPLHSSFVMGKMALAAKQGGAAAIRAQGTQDIREIRKVTGLPVIGLIKRSYADSEIYITPTLREVEELLTTGCEMIALDMTERVRPGGIAAELLVKKIQENGTLVLADISTYEEGKKAAMLGADAVSTTLSGYTSYSPQQEGPDFALVESLARDLSLPVFAEGRIQTPEEMKKAMDAGAYAPIIGSAITRPQLITAGFSAMLK